MRITKQLLEDCKVPELGKDEIAIYEVIGIGPDMSRVVEGNKKRPMLYPDKDVPNKDRILNPKTDEMVDIAYITGESPSEMPGVPKYNYGDIYFNKQSFGVIKVDGKSNRQKELYKYLELTNHNISNVGKPFHLPFESDQKYKYKFRRIDTLAEAKVKRDTTRKKRDAFLAIASMNPDQILNAAKALLSNYKKTTEELSADLEAYVDSKPENAERLLNLSEDVNAKAKIFAETLLDKKIIELTQASVKFAGEGRKICNRHAGETWQESLKRHLLSEVGADDYKTLEGLVQGDEVEASPDELEDVRKEYQEKFDKRPYHGWDVATLKEKLLEEV